MGVAFCIVFLLIASPVRKEDACKMKTESQKVVPMREPELAFSSANDGKGHVANGPTVKTEDSVKGEYEFGHSIFLKWSIQNAHGYKIKFKVIFSKAVVLSNFDKEHPVHHCNDPPKDECLEYQLPVLEPDDYIWKIQFTFSIHGESKYRAISGSFSVKKPSLTIRRPVDNHEYRHDHNVVLEWSMVYDVHEVTQLQISVWDTKTTEPKIYPVPCTDSAANQCKLPLLPVGSYEWSIQGLSPRLQTMKCRGVGSFTIFEIPVPTITEPLGAKYENKDKDKIVVKWTIEGPKHIIESIMLWVWNAKNDKRRVNHSPECTDIHNCYQFLLPPQKPGDYKCNLLVVSTTGKKAASTISCDFVVLPDDAKKGEFCGQPPKQDNLLQKKRLADKASDAAEHSWPWIGLLKIDKAENSLDECIVNLLQVKGNKKRSDMLVTSGKCITTWKSIDEHPDGGQTIEIDTKQLQVFPGIHNTKDPVKKPIQIVQEVRKHNKYEQTKHGHSHLYDAGLVRVHPPVDFDEDNHPICRPLKTDPVPERVWVFHKGWKCVVAGFKPAGSEDSGRTLKQMIVYVYPNTDCKSYYSEFDETHMMCGLPAGWPSSLAKKSKLTSNDNGASLHCFNETSPWRLYGTVTMSGRDLRNGYPFFFTRFKGEIAEWVSKTADDMSYL